VVHCDAVNVNVAQVSRGMAWVYRQYNHDATLPAVEATARLSRVGLWSEARPLEPWVYRKERKAATANGRS
jgi:micrococcal nuclease